MTVQITYFQSFRSISFLSLLRFKRQVESSSTEKSTDKESWNNTLELIENESLLRTSKPVDQMTRTELRKWKKRTFLHILEMFIQRSGKTRRGYNQFVLNALEKMPEYEVVDDLDCYKAVIRLFPVGRMVVVRFLQAEFGHFPRQQQTMIRVLQQMARHHVLPDDEVGQMIIDVFGWRSHAMQHYRHMMYWVPKLYHTNPWPLTQTSIRHHLDTDPARLAQLIAERITPDLMTQFTLIKLSNEELIAGKPSALISAQSPEQCALLSHCTKHTPPTIYLDGPHYVWYRNLQATYYTLWTEISPDRLRREIQTVERNKKSNQFNDDVPWELNPFGPSLNQSDVVTDSVENEFTEFKYLRVQPPGFGDSTTKLMSHLVSHKIIKTEPEFDNRWLALRRSHEYKYLPKSLTQHEQGEGTILAVAVVVPTADALINQMKLYEWEVSNSVYKESASDAASEPDHDHACNFDAIPQPASSLLIRYWLQQLREKNPNLDKSTLIIRAPFESIESVDRR